MFKRAVLGGLIGLMLATQAAGQTPRRIVSFNLCADQLLVALADPEQIAGLSPYAIDKGLSVVSERAHGFPRLDWTAESVVNLAPDLVFIGPTARPTQAMLSAMGIRVADVALVGDFAAARRQAREFGALIGHPERGEALAKALENAEARLRASVLDPPRTALVMERRGYVAGPDSLVTAMIAAAGLHPPRGAPEGYGGFVTLERLIADQPDILLLKDAPAAAYDQAATILTHPALRAVYSGKRLIEIPARHTLCGGPALLEGLESLARAVDAIR
jgi:iron complex transport system substrate-binding protein